MGRPGIVWNGSSLLSPLTGVGQYTAQLLRELSAPVCADPDTDLHVFLGRRWQSVSQVSNQAFGAPAFLSPRASLARTQLWRGMLSMAPWLRRAARYRQLQFFERGCRDRQVVLYHEPNFIAFPFDGPIVVTVHDLSFLRHPESHPSERVRFMSARLPDSLERASVVLADSDFVRQELISEFGTSLASKIRVVLLGVSREFFPRSQQDPVSQSILHRYQLRHKSYLLSVGTLEPRKNLITLIRAYVSLSSQIKSRFPLVIAGPSGWHTSDFEKELNRYRHEPIRLLGYVSQQELPLLYSGATLSIYPSLYEGFGLPVLESMASGTPVVASNASAIPQVIGTAGLLPEPQDEKGFTQAITQIIETPSLADQLSRLGLERATNLSWAKSASEIREIYRPLLRRGGCN